MASDLSIPHRISKRAEFVSYLGSTAGWSGAFAMRMILFNWILVGILQEPAAVVGVANAIIGLPGILFMLYGGAIGDEVDGRKLLIRMHLLVSLPPALLAVTAFYGYLNFYTVITYAVFYRVFTSFAGPARQSILNHIVGANIQRGVVISSLVQRFAQVIFGFIAGLTDYISIEALLALQAFLVLSGAVFMLRVQAQSPAQKRPEGQNALGAILEGMREVWGLNTIRNIMILNFGAGLFNMGAMGVSIPFIARDIYGIESGEQSVMGFVLGAGLIYGALMTVFRVGEIISSSVLIWFTPILRPTRLLMITQLSRGIIVSLVALHPNLLSLFALMMVWGANQTISMTIARSVVQEMAPASHRARMLSVFQMGNMGAMPIGTLIMGFLVGGLAIINLPALGPLNALFVGTVASAIMFVWALKFTRLWWFESDVVGAVEESLGD